MQKGPISKVIPTGAGTGHVIAILSDPNYKVILDMYNFSWNLSYKKVIGIKIQKQLKNNLLFVLG